MRQSFALEFCDQKLSLEQRGEIWESGSIVGGNNSDGGGEAIYQILPLGSKKIFLSLDH